MTFIWICMAALQTFHTAKWIQMSVNLRGSPLAIYHILSLSKEITNLYQD